MSRLVPATATGWLGPWPATDFALAPPAPLDALTPAERYYFDSRCIAVPRPGLPLAGYARGQRAAADVIQWGAHPTPEALAARAALVLLGAPLVADEARLDASATTITLDGRTQPFTLVPRLPLNRSWFDASSAAFFAARSLRIRAMLDGATVVASTLWPEEFGLATTPPRMPLAAEMAPALALRAHMREDDGGGAELPFAVHGLWEREGWAGDWKDKPVLAVIVNGAQGDDDEAWGGHFAIATGRTTPGGAIADLIVDNFYTLDVESEKGILAAPVPLDAYLGELNSGQAWYRPSYVLVAALASNDALALVQGAFDRVYRQFWRHQLAYRHSTMNCAGVSVDVLRALGLPVLPRTPERRWRAWFALPWVALTQRSLFKARLACEYLAEDVTRLLPAAAFEETCAALLGLAAAPAPRRTGARAGARGERSDSPAGYGPLAVLLERDLDAIALLRIPQFPSSRRFGSYPVVSADEYFAAIPGDPADMEVVPVPPRPFPRELRDDDLLPRPREASDVVLAVWIAALAVLVVVTVIVVVHALPG